MNASSETWRSFSLVDGLTVMFIMDLCHPPTSNRICSLLDCDANGFGHNQLGRAVRHQVMGSDEPNMNLARCPKTVIIKIKARCMLSSRRDLEMRIHQHPA